MRRSRYFGAALFGLLVVAAITVAAGSGRKPALENATASIRMLTDAEAAQLSQRFPELKLGRGGEIGQFRNEAIERAFPTTYFYRAYDLSVTPPLPRMIAVSGDTHLPMPDGLSKLLARYSISVNDDNIIELAQTFVLLAVGDQHFRPLDSFPSIVFLEARRIKQRIGSISCEAKLKVRVGEQVEEWYFDSRHGHLSYVERRVANGRVKFYVLSSAEPRREQGLLYQTPCIDIGGFRGQGISGTLIPTAGREFNSEAQHLERNSRQARNDVCERRAEAGLLLDCVEGHRHARAERRGRHVLLRAEVERQDRAEEDVAGKVVSV